MNIDKLNLINKYLTICEKLHIIGYLSETTTITSDNKYHEEYKLVINNASELCMKYSKLVYSDITRGNLSEIIEELEKIDIFDKKSSSNN